LSCWEFGIQKCIENDRKKTVIANKIVDWVKSNNQMIIAGHTHRAVFPAVGQPPYFNDGCCVHPYGITGIEIVHGKIALVKWSVKTKDDVPCTSAGMK